MRLGAWSAIAVSAIKVAIAYTAWFWADTSIRILSMVIIVAFWTAIYTGTTTLGTLNLDQTLNYVLIATLIAGVGNNELIWRIGSYVRDGTIVHGLLRPIDFQLGQLAMDAGRSLFLFSTRLPLFGIAALAFGLQLPGNPLVYLAALVTLILGALALFFFDWIISCLGFYTTEVWGLSVLRFGIELFFSGQLLPLEMMPEVLRTIALILPFSGVVYLPVSLLAQITPLENAPQLWLIQIAEIILLAVISRFIFARAIRVVTVQGG